MFIPIGAFLALWAGGLALFNHKSLLLPWVLVSAFVCFGMGAALGRDLGQWGNVDPEIAAWYRSLKQPDSPLSCCGEADSYYCDEGSRGSQIYCIINDERDNATLKRIPIPNGTEIKIPLHKLNHDSNPTGRAIVFLSSGGDVYCFIGAGGV